MFGLRNRTQPTQAGSPGRRPGPPRTGRDRRPAWPAVNPEEMRMYCESFLRLEALQFALGVADVDSSVCQRGWRPTKAAQHLRPRDRPEFCRRGIGHGDFTLFGEKKQPLIAQADDRAERRRFRRPLYFTSRQVKAAKIH